MARAKQKGRKKKPLKKRRKLIKQVNMVQAVNVGMGMGMPDDPLRGSMATQLVYTREAPTLYRNLKVHEREARAQQDLDLYYERTYPNRAQDRGQSLRNASHTGGWGSDSGGWAAESGDETPPPVPASSSRSQGASSGRSRRSTASGTLQPRTLEQSILSAERRGRREAFLQEGGSSILREPPVLRRGP